MARFDRYFEAVVISAVRITPNMVRLRFGGDELRAWRTSGDPDERLTVAFPAPGAQRPPRPQIVDGAWHYDDEPERRSYTVRRVEKGTLDIDFVVHEGGVAPEWAMRAQPGDIAGLSLAGGWYERPADATEVLLVGDATALPAIGRIIEEMPSGVRAHAIIEVATADDAQAIDTRADVQYTWLIGTGMGSSPSALPDTVRSLELPASGLYVWAAAEAAATRAIRKYLRVERNMPNSAMTVIGYWRANKELWLQRYEPAKDELIRHREELEERGVTGQDLIEAMDQELERAGL